MFLNRKFPRFCLDALQSSKIVECEMHSTIVSDLHYVLIHKFNLFASSSTKLSCYSNINWFSFGVRITTIFGVTFTLNAEDDSTMAFEWLNSWEMHCRKIAIPISKEYGHVLKAVYCDCANKLHSGFSICRCKPFVDF